MNIPNDQRSTVNPATAAILEAATATNVINYSALLSPLGDASGVAILLGNHAKFGLAERCW